MLTGDRVGVNVYVTVTFNDGLIEADGTCVEFGLLVCTPLLLGVCEESGMPVDGTYPTEGLVEGAGVPFATDGVDVLGGCWKILSPVGA